MEVDRGVKGEMGMRNGERGTRVVKGSAFEPFFFSITCSFCISWLRALLYDMRFLSNGLMTSLLF